MSREVISTHYVVNIDVKRVDKVKGERREGTLGQTKVDTEEREVVDVTHIVLKGGDLCSAIEKATSHMQLIDEDGVEG